MIKVLPLKVKNKTRDLNPHSTPKKPSIRICISWIPIRTTAQYSLNTHMFGLKKSIKNWLTPSFTEYTDLCESSRESQIDALLLLLRRLRPSFSSSSLLLEGGEPQAVLLLLFWLGGGGCCWLLSALLPPSSFAIFFAVSFAALAPINSQRNIVFSGLECVGYSFAYVAHFVLLRDVWIRTQRTAVASRRATNLANHLPKKHTQEIFFLDK